MAKQYLEQAAVTGVENTPVTIRGLTAVTVLLGKNGSGKSILLRRIRDLDPTNSHYVIPERSGPINLQPHFIAQQLSPVARQQSAQQNFVDNYRPHIIARLTGYFGTRGNVRSDQVPVNPNDLEDLLAMLVPEFRIELHGGANPPYILRRFETDAIVAGVEELSSGETQLLTIGLDILTISAIWELEKKERRILLLDEPDAHIHPDLQARFAHFLAIVARQYSLQIIIATHSTTLLAAIGEFVGEDVSVAFIRRSAEEIIASPISTEMKELAVCLGGHVLMGALFGAPLLLVEGDDENRVWSQVPRHHKIKLAVLPTNGEEIYKYQAALERLFSSLRDAAASPIGFALIDGDKPKSSGGARPQAHVRFIQLECRETENLYLTDEVLAAMGTDWPRASELIAQSAGQYGNKAAKLREVAKSDRRTVDLKPVILELAAIVDPKRVHWTLRVGKVVGANRPTGQLAEFLGSNVVDALWGKSC